MMLRLPGVFLATLVASSVGACDGSAHQNVGVDSASLPDGSSPTDAAVDSREPKDLGSSGEAITPPDTRPEPTGLPLPPGVVPPHRILDGKATVAGDGSSACSRQDPPSGDGDRWCAFTVPGASQDRAELWVMNVTRAAAGEAPPCDGTSRDCLRMTTSLWTAHPLTGPNYPYSDGFDGDTLIFYADSTTTSDELHRGPIYAWRPGWSGPRQISSASGLLCAGHPRAAVAYCLDDLIGAQDKPDSFELRVGSLADENGGLLPSLGRIRPFRADGKTAWQVGFSLAGDVFAYSSPDPDPAVETLRMIAIPEAGRSAPREVLRDATSWSISNDGQRVYFERGSSKDVLDLNAADFPAGSNVTRLGSSVQDYTLVGDGPSDIGVGFVTAVDAVTTAFRLVRDIRMPSAFQTVFTFENMLEDVRFSSDGRFTLWRDNMLVARVVRNDGLASCVLNTDERLEATAPRLLASSGLVFWTESGADNRDRQDGFVASPDGCAGKRRFAQGVYLVIEPVADRGLIFADEYDTREETVTLKYAGVTTSGKDWGLDPPVRISEGVRPSSVIIVGTKPLFVVFQKWTGGAQEQGTYLFGPVPF